MRPLDRQSRIIDTVRARGKASVDELAEMFGTSVETIRRDLSSLARKGRLEKIHGGAIPPRSLGEGPFEQRMQRNGLAKRHIAQKLRELISPGDTLLIDTGSTTLIVAEELAAPRPRSQRWSPRATRRRVYFCSGATISRTTGKPAVSWRRSN